MENDKPRLSLDEQIQHLKDKGILFNIMDEESAKQYLKYNNNLNCKMKLELRNWDKGACPFIPIRAAAGPLFSIFL